MTSLSPRSPPALASSTPLPDVLRPLATANGAICALALDHRDALRTAYERAGVANVTERLMLELKARINDALGGTATAVLVDAAALGRCRPTGAGVLMALEAQGHDALAGGRLNRMLDDFGPEDAEALGVQGCKLLLYYRDDHTSTASRQLTLAAQAAERCHRRNLALVVEPKVYRLEGEDPDSYARCFGDHVVAAASALADCGADLLKLQFPGDEVTCRRVTAAAGSVPWTLLGGAEVSGQVFAEQVRIAVDAGACGFIAGRAIWGGALALEVEDQPRWLREQALPVLERLVEIAETHARRGR